MSNKCDKQVAYSARVEQHSGEHWADAGELVLSTTQPSMNVVIPELETIEAAIYRPPETEQPTSIHLQKAMMQQQQQQLQQMQMSGGDFHSHTSLLSKMITRTATATDRALSAEFTIPSPAAAIPSDGAAHKVTIGLVTLGAQLLHEAVPARSLAAFVTASCTNSSALALLRGRASVYLDGSFISKTTLPAVSPAEHFKVSLGIDPAVKIEYPPKLRNKQRISDGGIFKNSVQLQHEQKVVIRNTRKDAILLTIREAIPRPTDDTIQLNILSPQKVDCPSDAAMLLGEGEAREPGARLHPASNILEWTVRVGTGTSLPLSIGWTLDYPASESITMEKKKGKRSTNGTYDISGSKMMHYQ